MTGRLLPSERVFITVHRVASLLKRRLLGAHPGAVEPQHLPYYLDEFTSHFNRRTSRLAASCSLNAIRNFCGATSPASRYLMLKIRTRAAG